MYLRKASQLLKPVCVQTLNTEIENIARTLSASSNMPSSHIERNFNLNTPKYLTNIKLWHHHYIYMIRKQFYATLPEQEEVDSNTFERVCEETLNSLADYFEDLVANQPKFEKADVVYGAGVLTIDLGNYGTYVINRQSPNKQIWLSSPTSGPKRFDYLVKEDCWIYKHDGKTLLHSLLKKEFESILNKEIRMSHCSHSNLQNS